MDAATIAGIVAIITALSGAVATVITALRTKTAVKEVADNVNGHLTKVTARTEQLTAALTDANVIVPPSPEPPSPPL